LDELPPKTRKLLGLVVAMVQEQRAAQQIGRAQYRFSRRTVRECTRWGDTQLKIHLGRLTELEYLLVHRGGRGQSFEYELLFDAPADGSAAHGTSQSGSPHVNGLIDVEALREGCGAQHPYDAGRSASNAERSGSGRELVGVQSADGRAENFATAAADSVSYPYSFGAHNGIGIGLYQYVAKPYVYPAMHWPTTPVSDDAYNAGIAGSYFYNRDPSEARKWCGECGSQ
jgi:hypothetical protein